MASHDGTDSSPMAVEKPLGSEEEFAQELRELVAEDAPRLFALVEEYGERVDGWIVAWGIVFDDRVVLGADGGLRMILRSVERAHRVYSRRRKIRLVWARPPVSGDASCSS